MTCDIKSARRKTKARVLGWTRRALSASGSFILAKWSSLSAMSAGTVSSYLMNVSTCCDNLSSSANAETDTALDRHRKQATMSCNRKQAPDCDVARYEALIRRGRWDIRCLTQPGCEGLPFFLQRPLFLLREVRSFAGQGSSAQLILAENLVHPFAAHELPLPTCGAPLLRDAMCTRTTTGLRAGVKAVARTIQLVSHEHRLKIPGRASMLAIVSNLDVLQLSLVACGTGS